MTKAEITEITTTKLRAARTISLSKNGKRAQVIVYRRYMHKKRSYTLSMTMHLQLIGGKRWINRDGEEVTNVGTSAEVTDAA